MAEQTSRLAIIIDSTGAKRSAETLSTALDRMTKSGDSAVESAIKVAKAAQDEKAALDKLRAAIDPIGAAIDTVGRRYTELKKYFDKGLIDKEEFQFLSKKLNETTAELSGVAQAQRDAEKAGKEAAAQQEAQSLAFQRMIDRIDPLSAALRNLDQQQKELSSGLTSGKIDAAQFDTYTQKLQQTRKEITGEAQAEREAAKAHDEQVAALRRLEAQLDPVGEAFRRLNQQQKQLDNAKSSGILSSDSYDKLSGRIGEMRVELEKAQSQLGKTGQSAAQTANAMRMVPAQFTDIVVSLASGQAPLTVLLQQGGQLKDMFGGIGPAFKGLASYAAGLVNPFTLATAAVGAFGLAYYKGSQEQDEFYKSLTLTGNQIGKTSGQLADIAARVSATTDATVGAASSTLNQLVSSGKVASDSLENVTTAIVKTSNATGITTDKLVDDFNKIAANPVEAISKLNDQYHFLTLSTYEQIKALQDQGNTQEAARVANEAYSSSLIQRSNDIKNNLGTLERAWNGIAGAAKSAWDSMLDIGREVSVEQKIQDASGELERAQRALSDLERGQAANAGPYGAWKSDDIDRQQKVVTLLKQRLTSLQSEKTTQDVLNDSINSYNKRQQDGIELLQRSDSFAAKYQTRQQQMSKELKELNDLKDKGAKLDFDALEAQIRDRYKEPKTRKEKAYTEDAGTRMLDQLRQQQQVLLSQADTGDKIGTQAQALIKWEQQLADIKSKQTLTADQKSLLANADIITAQLQQNAAIERQIQSREKLLALEKARADIARTIENRQSQYGAEEFMASGGLSQYEQQQYTQRLSLEQSYNDKITQLRQSRAQATSDIAREEIDQEIELQRQALDTELRNYDEHIARMNAARGSFSAGANRAWQEYVDSAANVSGMSQQLFTNAFSGMEDALVSFVVHGKASFRDFATSIISDLARIAARQALVGLGSSIFGSLFSAGASAATSASAGQSFAVPSFRPNAKGGVYDSPSLSSYSNGIYNSPQFFAFAKGAGVFGEAGPEAIMPLARGSNGSLGVRAIGASSSAPAINIGDINVEFNGEGQAADTTTQNTVAAAKQLQGIVLKTVTDWAKKEMSPGGVLYRKA